ncbi:MAG: HPr family phosphocarrier protein [Lachnospiraceae bacterium]|jgi:phosphocarrier protein HPr|nr:HPr family phosphocarrier protein [Lachnospiraceae bacterium]
MKKFNIRLNSAEDAEEFVNAASQCDFEIDLYSGSVALDAKSLLGVLTMGTNRVLEVVAQQNDPAFYRKASKFVVAA